MPMAEGITWCKQRWFLFSNSPDTWWVSGRYPLGITGKKIKIYVGHFGKWNAHRCKHSIFQNALWILVLDKCSNNVL